MTPKFLEITDQTDGLLMLINVACINHIIETTREASDHKTVRCATIVMTNGEYYECAEGYDAVSKRLLKVIGS